MMKADLGIIFKQHLDKETHQMDFTCFVEALISVMLKGKFGSCSESRILGKFDEKEYCECLMGFPEFVGSVKI